MSFLFGTAKQPQDENAGPGFNAGIAGSNNIAASNGNQQQQQHPLGTLNRNYAQLIAEEERQQREAEEAERKLREKNASPDRNSTNEGESPPTSPPRSEAPPPSDDEFTNFVLRRAAKQLGVDFIPGQFSNPGSRNNSPRGGGNKNGNNIRHGDEKSGASSSTLPNPFASHHQGASGSAPANPPRGQQQHSPPASSSHHAGAAHPIDTLKAHHWRDQITVDDVAEIPVPRFPSTLKAARRIATVEKRLQEPPPSGLQRFGQFIDCSPEEIARMISLRETSLGETHASVPPLYDVLGDMLLFEGDSPQAERYYTTCLQRLEQRSAHMQQQEKDDLERLAGGGGRAVGGGEKYESKFSRFHPSNKSNPNSWLSQATNWSKEVATINAKLGMLWMNQGKKESACAAFLRAAELVDPTGYASQFSYQPRAGSNTNNNSNVRGSSLSPNPSSYNRPSSSVAPNNNNNENKNANDLNRRPNESLESAHLRQLLTGLPKPVAVKAGNRTGTAGDNNNVVESDIEDDYYDDSNMHEVADFEDGDGSYQVRKRDRGAIASALADRILVGMGGPTHQHHRLNAKSPTRTIDVQTILSAPKDNDDHFREYLPSRGDSRSASQSHQQNMHTSSIQMLPLGAATPLQRTPMRRSSVSQQPPMNHPQAHVSNTSPNLHDASSLKNLVDSITQDGKMEDSRRRMRSTLIQQQSTSPMRAGSAMTNYDHHSLPSQNADTHETLRKTKDLQDIIARIRNRADLMC